MFLYLSVFYVVGGNVVNFLFLLFILSFVKILFGWVIILGIIGRINFLVNG